MIAVEYRLLGPVEVVLGDRVLDIGHARQRAVLAVVLLDAGRVVSDARLIGCVWGEDPPASVRNSMYGYVTRLRAVLALGGERVVLARRAGGYVLQARPEQVDLFEFRRLVREAAGAADGCAAELLHQALGLWRGPALAGLESPWLDSMRDTLEQERHSAALDLNDVRLRLGQHAAVAVELGGQAAAHPDDERLAGQLMLALYRSGRQAEALRWFERTRTHLADELGAIPGPELRALHEGILRADPALSLPSTGLSAQTAKPRAPVPRELPADVAAFTGRAAELAALDQLLLGRNAAATAAVISAVSGTAGVGKTALAVHWAHSAAAHFPDGQLHVNLRGYDPSQPVSASDALARFLGSLGVPGPEIPPEEEERAARYRSLLAGRLLLVVLDNAATLEQVRPLLPGHPECRVLVTSRDSLAGLVARDGARRLDLDLLPLEDSVALLAELIGDRAAADPDAVTGLAQLCARLPLALRVAAELAASRPAAPLAELVAELKDEQRRLDLLSADSDPRSAVRAVFSWSYEHLDAQSARAFRLAGLHPGADFEAYAVAALIGGTLEEARRALDTLARAHLAQPTVQGRHVMHDLLRAYARDLAAETDGEDESRAALTRLFDHYLSTAAAAVDTLHPAERHRRPDIAESLGPEPQVTDPGKALAWLDGERANLAAFAVHAAAHGWAGHATRLSAVLFRYLASGGHVSVALLIHSAARRAAQQAGDLAAEAAALTAMGGASRVQGRYEQAAEQLRQALALFRRAGDRLGQARALYNVGGVELEQGTYRQAARHFREGLSLYREVGDLTGQATAINALGVLAAEQGRYREAAGSYQQALDLYRSTGHRQGEALALDNLGNCERQLGRCQQAADHNQQALALAREVGDRRIEAQALHNLGLVEHQAGRYGQAAGLLRQALAIFREIGHPAAEAEGQVCLGAALLAAGQPDEAQREYAAGLAMASQIGHKRHQAVAHDGLGNCRRAIGDLDGARGHWEQALELFTELGVPEAAEVRARLGSLSEETA